MDIESIIAAANRAQQADNYCLSNCSRILHMGFFFDGTGRNIDLDAPEHRLSNIARLYRAYPFAEQNTTMHTYAAHYFSGLGTPFDEKLPEKLKAMMDGAQSSAIDDLKNLPADTLKDTVRDAMGSADWKAVLGEQKRKLLKPTTPINKLKDITVGAARRVSIEATPWLRDNPLVSDMLVTGVDTRLASARLRFKKSAEESKAASNVPVRLISVSIFGFDLGGTMARQFIDALQDELCEKDASGGLLYQGVPVNIIFTGLLDCSRHTAASSNSGLEYVMWLLGGIGQAVGSTLGEAAIDHCSPLPAVVKKSLHLVAAHERRVWRSVYRTGQNDEHHREELLPGCSEDVGGGLKPDEQKPSAELCRVALQRMYREATMAGVPFMDFNTLYKTDRTVWSYFIMQDNVENLSAEQWVKRYQKGVPPKSLSSQSQNRHLDSYFGWLGYQYYLYRHELQRLSKMPGSIISSPEPSAGFAGLNPAARAALQDVQQDISLLKQHWGWLDDVWDASGDLVNLLHHPHDSRLRLAPEIYGPALERALRYQDCRHRAYKELPAPLPEDSAPPEIYAWYVHDLQTVDKTARITTDFLCIRTMELPTA